LQQYKYYIWTEGDDSEENVLFAQTLDHAIEFFNKLYLDIHSERRQNVVRIELIDSDGEQLLNYNTHMGVIKSGN
jgi:hypothetical protein